MSINYTYLLKTLQKILNETRNDLQKHLILNLHYTYEQQKFLTMFNFQHSQVNQ